MYDDELNIPGVDPKEAAESDEPTKDAPGGPKSRKSGKGHGKAADLEARAEAAEAKRDEYLETLQRLQADFDNYRKRVAKEQSILIESANEKLIAKLLPLVDNFERAVFVAEHTKDIEGLIKGVEMVYAELVATLEREGLKEVPAEGAAFDPAVHEAVMEVDSDEHEPNTVVDVLRKGYTLNGRLVRPAMVKVTRG